MIDPISLTLNIATGVLSNIVHDRLGRVLKSNEEKKFKKIVENVLKEYKVEIDENVAKELFEGLIFGDREKVNNIAEEEGLVDFVKRDRKKVVVG